MNRLALVGLAAVLGSCGGGEDEARRDPFTAIEKEAAEQSRQVRSAPRWERLTVLTGAGDATRTVTVAEHAIQWRARCEAGVTVRVGEDAGPCREGRTFIGRGEQRVEVGGRGEWRVVVEQQVETPIDEPPLPGMTPGRLVASGAFVKIEHASKGRALLYRLPGDRFALRFEDFRTSANTDLFVWLSRARRPRTTKQALAARHRTLRGLKSTVGDQNYLLPAGTRREDLRSIVIWCEPIRIAYTASPLRWRAAGS